MNDQIELVEVLFHLTSHDNSIRQLAETKYDNFKSMPEKLIFSLISISQQPEIVQYIRELACVLLRRILIEEKESFYFQIPNEKKYQFLDILIHSIASESNFSIKLKLCDIAGELSGYILEPNQWPELISFAYSCAKDTNPINREIGLVLIDYSSSSVINFDSNQILALNEILSEGLKDLENDGKIIIAAVKALSSIIQTLPRESQQDDYRMQVANLFTGLKTLMENFSENRVCLYLENLIELAEERPSFLSLDYSSFLPALIDLTAQNDILINIKILLIELLVTIGVESPKKIRKYKGNTNEKNFFAIKFIPICLGLISQIQDDPDWEVANTLEEYDINSSLSSVGESALNRVCLSLGVRSTYSIISSCISSYLISKSWKFQYAGLQCISNYLEVSATIQDKTQMLQHENEVLATLMAFTQNSHPRVKNATYSSLSQFFIMHGNNLTVDQINSLADVLIQNINNAQNSPSRLRRTILISLINLIDIAPTSFLEEKSGHLLSCITNALKEGPVIVQESCLSAIISLSESIKGSKSWLNHYPVLMPLLKSLLSYAQSQHNESLWSQVLECCAILGESAGKDIFYQDALEMMNMIYQVQTSIDQNSESEASVLKALVRIARCLGSEFLPYLNNIMQKLFNALSVDPSISITENNLQDYEDRSDIEMVETNSGWVAIRSEVIEEQSTACQLIILLCERLKEHFYPYVEQTMGCIPSLINSPHEDIRSYALAALPELVLSTGRAMPNNRTPLVELSGFCMGLLIRTIETEATLELIMSGIESIKQILFIACTDWAKSLHEEKSSNQMLTTRFTPPDESTSIKILNVEQMDSLIQCTKGVLRESLQRRAVLRAEAKMSGNADEDDMDDEMQFMTETMELHYCLSDLIGAIFKTHGSSFYSVFFNQFNEMTSNLSHTYCLKEDQLFAYYIICDVIESGLDQETAPSYINEYMPKFIQACNESPFPDVKRVCAYAIGVTCEKYIKEFLPHTQNALLALKTCISAGEEGPGTRGPCTDNAVSSVGIILEKTDDCGVDYNNDFIWGEWLSYLPIKDDEEESERVMAQILKLLSMKKKSLIEPIDRLSKSFLLLIEMFEDPKSSEKTKEYSFKVIQKLYKDLLLGHEEIASSLGKSMSSQQFSKLLSVIERGNQSGSNSIFSSSPLATAPIHDVLMRRG